MAIWDRRLLVVTGKGGVGKTTVCAALALAAARKGKRVLICETQGAERIPSLFGQRPHGYQIGVAAPGISSFSITSEASIEDYLLKVLHFKRLYQMVFRNRVMGPFIDAVPGLHDLIQLGKIMDLERTPGYPVDLYIVDAPATGHGVAMLTAPRTMMDLTRRGPFHDNARLVADVVEDPQKTSLILVSTPEEMPVNETLDLYGRLGKLRSQVAGVLLNEVHPPPVSDPAMLRACLPTLRTEESNTALLDLAEQLQRRQERQDIARSRLATLPAPRWELPFLYHRNLGLTDLEKLASTLLSAQNLQAGQR